MTTPEPKRVLFVGPHPDSVRWGETMLGRKTFAVHQVNDIREALVQSAAHEFELVMPFLLRWDDAWLHLCANLAALELPHVPAVVFFLCDPALAPHGPALRNAGARGILLPPMTPPQIDQALGEALGIRAREGARILFRLQLEGRVGNVSLLCNSVDVSEVGALVEANKRLEQGSQVLLKAMGPGDLAGALLPGKVVRTLPSGREGHYLMGIQFTSIQPVDGERWKRFIQSLR